MTDTLARLRAGELAGATRLTLRADLTEFPEEIYALADSLEILDLSGNRLTRLPADLGRLHRLRILFCSGNPFTELPEVLGTLPNLEMIGFKACELEQVSAAALPPRLRWLILTDNRIATLPTTLGERPALQKLMLAGNQLEALPASMAELHQLELLRLSANRFAALPPAILDLPRLTWLAYGDNPLGAAREQAVRAQAAQQQRIAWRDLQLGERLGEGASGIIHQACWQSPEGPREVAVKLFKGSMTSDGTPESESAASLSAGTHPWLIGALGDLADHPEQRSGLVLELVEPAFGNLAGPPSFTTCSRDVYPEDTRFTAAAVREMAGGMASALAHLHGCSASRVAPLASCWTNGWRGAANRSIRAWRPWPRSASRVRWMRARCWRTWRVACRVGPTPSLAPSPRQPGRAAGWCRTAAPHCRSGPPAA